MNRDQRFAGASYHEGLFVYGISVPIHPLQDADNVAEEAGLVPWAGDEDNLVSRFDARLLLEPLDIRPTKRARIASSYDQDEDQLLEQQLDIERYRDLFHPPLPPSDDDEKNKGNAEDYAAIPFKYESGDDQHDEAADGNNKEERKDQVDEPFIATFPLPEEIQNAPHPTTQKQFEVMSKTAAHIRQGGGQLEVFLRVKQANNPKFHFLVPSDPLHPFFRWLVTADCTAVLQGQKGINIAPDVPQNGGGGDDNTQEAQKLQGNINEMNREKYTIQAEPTVPHTVVESTDKGGGGAIDTSTNTATNGKERTEEVEEDRAMDALAGLGDYGTHDNVTEEDEKQQSLAREQQQQATPVSLPHDQRMAVDKFIRYVKHSGPAFAAMVYKKERDNPLFSFLNPQDPGFHQYKEALLSQVGEEQAAEILAWSQPREGATTTTHRKSDADGSNEDLGVSAPPPWVQDRQQQKELTDISDKKKKPDEDNVDSINNEEPNAAAGVIDPELEARLAERRRKARELLAGRRRAAFVKEQEEHEKKNLSAIKQHKRMFLDD